MSGLRERKKQATRAAIRGAAMRLFEARGFGATTIDQIAEAANVSRATVFSYFATKEEIVFGDAPEALRALEAALDARPEGQDVTAAFRAWLLAIGELGRWLEPELVLQLRLASEAPTVSARRLAMHQQVEGILAAALAAELGEGRELAATLAAASLVAAVRVAEEAAARRMRDDGRALTPAEVDRLLTDAVGFAEAGISAIR